MIVPIFTPIGDQTQPSAYSFQIIKIRMKNNQIESQAFLCSPFGFLQQGNMVCEIISLAKSILLKRICQLKTL